MQIASATLESRLARLREASLYDSPRLGELNERLCNELDRDIEPGVMGVGDRAPEIELVLSAYRRIQDLASIGWAEPE